ncbi:MAG: hypothetical protein ACOYXN_02830 [Acidobacteriota bacterium]
MTCEEFLRLMDEAPEAGPLPPSLSRHAEGCAACSLALRTESLLRTAHQWTERPSLPVERRAHVLAAARIRGMFLARPGQALEEAGVTAAVLLTALALAWIVFPTLAERVLPPAVLEWAAPFTDPILRWLQPVSMQVRAMLSESWGAPLLGLTAFTVVLSAVFCFRVLSPMRFAAR